MNLAQFQAAFEIAISDVALFDDYLDPFDGFGLPDFDPVTVTLAHVAELIRWQSQYLGGGWDTDALNEIREHGRRKFIVVEPPVNKVSA